MPGTEDQFEVLVRLTTALAQTTRLDDVFDAALDALEAGVGPRAAVLLSDHDGVLRFKAWRGLSDEFRRTFEGKHLWSPRSSGPALLLVRDVEEAPWLASYLPVIRAERIGAMAFIPLISRESLIGKFMLYREAPHEWNAEELRVAEGVASHVAFAVALTHAEATARASEERLRFALEAADMGTWNWDLLTNRVRWSENLERLHGLPPGTFDGTFASYEREIHPADRDRVLASIARALADGVPHEVEYRIGAPDGTVKWVEGKGRVEYDAAGHPIRLMGVCVNVTRRKQAELERLDLRAKAEAARTRRIEIERRRAAFLAQVTETLSASLDYAATLSRLPDLAVPDWADWSILYVIDDNGQVRRAAVTHKDPRYTDLLSRLDAAIPLNSPTPNPSVLDVLGTGCSLLVSEFSPDSVASGSISSSHADLLRELGPRSYLAVPIRAHGRVIGSLGWMRGQGSELYTEEDLGLAEELSRRAGTAVEHAELYRDAQEANRLKDEFLATLSHELRTPLNAIVGWTYLLRERYLHDPSAKKALDTVIRNAEAQTQLISDLLDISAISSGKMRFRSASVDVSSVVETAIESVRGAAEAKSIALTVALRPDLTVWADPDRLRQIIWNLLTNAVKFTPPGGRIAIETEASEDDVLLRMTDSGIGIAPAFLPHIFERFRQVDASSTRTHTGLGLGLSIVRHLVELHGGTVSALSAGEGRGSTFTVRLPLLAARTTMGREDGVKPPVPGQPLAGRTLLVLDDQSDVRDLLREVLEGQGACVRTAERAEEALTYLRDEVFDLALVDIAMPGIDGYGFLRAMQGEGFVVPAIAVTAYVREEEVRAALDAGFRRHVPKPFAPGAVVATIVETLGVKP